jgi:rSAM/selenodomain-associated transferase 2
MATRLSIVMPVWNEAALVGAALRELAPLRELGAELIVVDGQSDDRSAELAQDLADVVLNAPRGRAAQMNAGAARASADVLLFLHVDTRLPAGALHDIETALAASPGQWGRFDVRIDGRSAWLRVVGASMNLRSRWTGIATGDQAIFATRQAFEAVGGFPEQPLMEDIELSKRLRRHSRPICLSQRVVTSGRRWERGGVLRTILLMWRLRLLYWLGTSAERLARSYR